MSENPTSSSRFARRSPLCFVAIFRFLSVTGWVSV
jgi:hypothetical protein